MIRSEIKRELIAAIRKKFGKIDIPDFSVAEPENPEHGDYATNAALVLAKLFKKPPMEIASAIAEEFRIKNLEFRVRVAAPGFINFFVSEKALRDELAEILKKREKYGAGTKKKEKIQVEFVSANPTGPLTLANGRGGFLGDVLANVLEYTGARIEREYYVNDTGNQILTLGKSILAAAGVIQAEENFYKGDYIKKWAKENSVKIKKLKDDPLKLGQAAAKDFLHDIKTSLAKKAKIKFDRWTSEDRHIHKKSFVKKALSLFEKKNLIYRKDGATWLKTTNFADDKDRVLITSDGYPTYFLADSGHYLETFRRGFKRKINILGPDHYGYVARIQAVAEIVGMKESEIIVTQAVRLMKGGGEFKISKRKGVFITFEELMDEVGPDAARYFFLEKSPDTHMDFDLDLAKERSVKNPVYYIQYAHARIASIFKKAQSTKLKIQKKFKTQNSKFKTPNKLEELVLIKKLIQFPEVVEDTASDYQVHRLTRYAYELARSFHNFYEKHRVISDDKELTQARLALVEATQIVLKQALKLLGISAPKKM